MKGSFRWVMDRNEKRRQVPFGSLGGPSNRARRHAAEYVTPPLKKQAVLSFDGGPVSAYGNSFTFQEHSGIIDVVSFPGVRKRARRLIEVTARRKE